MKHFNSALFGLAIWLSRSGRVSAQAAEPEEVGGAEEEADTAAGGPCVCTESLVGRHKS